ncbi:hypothetical protein AUEXF2481DRAFT_26899 [Aureobasidium subglaciale EXF-2481]|uniref:Uncharacterized protein n=1 Tax=Aureobasidium subglaciale (strain EXF-2481) TaxID=1043005 RepID=A0A074ZJ35_AURSE|nr:uncharacterized protein AUEXF2481DRAFT_26899 [Aureobasidium subglaciale EXF-2481]KEQ98531.1 hypothetical protein AUEXF2481DRAFT_26899 [Aureobasidium subglaciale EXF-2481]
MSVFDASASYNYRYYLLAGLYVVVIGGAFLRISRQPYAKSIKWEQYETVFKGTTLLAAISGFALSGQVNNRRSQPHHDPTRDCSIRTHLRPSKRTVDGTGVTRLLFNAISNPCCCYLEAINRGNYLVVRPSKAGKMIAGKFTKRRRESEDVPPSPRQRIKFDSTRIEDQLAELGSNTWPPDTSDNVQDTANPVE